MCIESKAMPGAFLHMLSIQFESLKSYANVKMDIISYVYFYTGVTEMQIFNRFPASFHVQHSSFNLK